MESSVSTPHCSFVMNLRQDLESLPQFIQDFRAFFQKFPLNYELVGVIDSRDMKSISALETLQKSAPANESWQLVPSTHKSRVQNIKIGIEKARSEIIILPSVVMATPLGDLFKVLQTLMTEPDLAACWGERFSKNSGAMHQPQSAAQRLEALFNKILKEKFPQYDNDTLCEIGGLRKSTWEKIKDSAPIRKKSGWYFVGSCQKALRDQGLKQQTVFVNDSGKRSLDFSMWRARLELLGQSLF